MVAGARLEMMSKRSKAFASLSFHFSGFSAGRVAAVDVFLIDVFVNVNIFAISKAQTTTKKTTEDECVEWETEVPSCAAFPL
jgi:hypothetical protein